jgi:transcriptional regulator with XRE-family HTH domain
MGKRNQPPDIFSTPIWATRITNLLEEKGMTQLELAKQSGTSPASISDWVGGSSQREPKVRGFKAVADVLEVSTDYLLGADECTTPTNEEIHKLTGLSDKAIKKLRKLQRGVKRNKDSAAKKLAACNYLLESMDSTDLFESLYSYLLGEFYFSSQGKDLGANFIYAKTPVGEQKEKLAFAESYSHVYLSKVLQALSLIKRDADKIKEQKEKENYEEWLKSDEGKAFELENLKLQAAYEDEEE